MKQEIKGKWVVVTGKFNCQSYPLNDKSIFITDEDLKQIDPINGTKCFDLENNCVIDYDNKEYLKIAKLQELKNKREPLLIAFDKYKSNVNYGIEFESETDRTNIITWYRLLLELNEKAFANVPERVKYYL
jgi:hypothetical protein